MCYAATAKTFLLKNQPRIQYPSLLFVRDTEIKISIPLCRIRLNQKINRPIQSPYGTAIVRICHILRMNDISIEKEHRSCQQFPSLFCNIQLDILREIPREQRHLISAMHWMHPMTFREDFIQKQEIARKIIAFTHDNAVLLTLFHHPLP